MNTRYLMAKWVLGVKELVAFKWGDTGELRTRKEDMWPESCVTISASDRHSGSSCKQQSSGASSGNVLALQKDTPANINRPCPSARILTEETISANDMQTSVCTFTSDYAIDSVLVEFLYGCFAECLLRHDAFQWGHINHTWFSVNARVNEKLKLIQLTYVVRVLRKILYI